MSFSVITCGRVCFMHKSVSLSLSHFHHLAPVLHFHVQRELFRLVPFAVLLSLLFLTDKLSSCLPFLLRRQHGDNRDTERG